MSDVHSLDRVRGADSSSTGTGNETVIQVMRSAGEAIESTCDTSQDHLTSRVSRGVGLRSYYQKFRPQWQLEPVFRDWLVPIAGDPFLAGCSSCGSTLRAHRKLLLMHCASQKHLQKLGRHRASSMRARSARRGGRFTTERSRPTIIQATPTSFGGGTFTDDAPTSGVTGTMRSQAIGGGTYDVRSVSGDVIDGWSPLAGVRVGFIGDGGVAQSLARGLLDRHLVTADSIVVSVASGGNYELWQRWGCQLAVQDDAHDQVLNECDLIYLAVNLDDLSTLLPSIHPACTSPKSPVSCDVNDHAPLRSQCIVSLVNGASRDHVETVLMSSGRWLPFSPIDGTVGVPGSGQQLKYHHSRRRRTLHVVRAIVSEAVMIAEGCCLFSAEQGPGGLPARWCSIIEAVFSTLGLCRRVTDEAMLPAAGAVVHGGPALTFALVDALTAGAEEAGVPRALSHALAAQTVLASARMLLETGRTADELSDATTAAAAVRTLDGGGMRRAVATAMAAAAASHQPQPVEQDVLLLTPSADAYGDAEGVQDDEFDSDTQDGAASVR